MAPAGGGCDNASAFSQQYINKPGGRFIVRCGPQAEAPVTYGTSDRQSSLSLPPDTPIIPRHVYENRRNTTDVAVPTGYKPAWDDGRLNPKRAERTLQPAKVEGIISVPAGFRVVNWNDNRLNLRRGITTAQGDAQTDLIWSNTVPRKLIPVPTRRQVVTLPKGTASIQDPETLVFTRLSTSSNSFVVLHTDR